MGVAEIDIGSNRTRFVNIPDDVIVYFGITAAAQSTDPKLRTRAAHTRQVYSDLDDNTGQQVSVEASEWYATSAIAEEGSGKPVIIPTKKTTTKGNTRTVTLRFPGDASVYSIQKFVKTRFLTNTPDWIKMASGRRYPVDVASVADPNPGNDPDPNP
ncbi:MAG: hypothetical protein HC910_21530 [Spirulinaceae cyanobacterium SM2_1_0]|nr:hypothetical protein [Spirulinaceae cyanobacterium SM2_1_0]